MSEPRYVAFGDLIMQRGVPAPNHILKPDQIVELLNQADEGNHRMMTMQDYKVLAAALASVRPANTLDVLYTHWAQTAIAIENALEADNPRFKRDLFRDACLAGSTGHVAVYRDQDGNRATVNIGPDGLPVQNA